MEIENNKYFEVEDTTYRTDVRAEDGEVKPYEITNIEEYPQFIIGDDTTVLDKGLLRVMQGLVTPLGVTDATLEPNNYFVYLETNTGKVKVGKLNNGQLKVFLRGMAFKNCKKRIKITKEEVIEGEILLAYCRTTI